MNREKAKSQLKLQSTGIWYQYEKMWLIKKSAFNLSIYDSLLKEKNKLVIFEKYYNVNVLTHLKV